MTLPKVAIGGGYFYNNLLDKSKNSWIGMVTVSIPINWKTGYSMRRGKLSIENASMEMADGSDRLTIAMRKSYNDLAVAYKNIDIARRSIEQAQENLRKHEVLYQAGTATMSDLLDAQTLYQQSCDRYSEAVANYRWAVIHVIIGTLFLAFGITHVRGHWAWFKSLAKTLKKKSNPNIVLSLLFIFETVSGIILLAFTDGSNSHIGLWHWWVGLIMTVFGIGHILKRWKTLKLGYVRLKK